MVPDQNKPLVLVADDDPTFRLLARESLCANGFSVVEAENGAQAVSAFRQELPDLLLLDVIMPVMNGFAVCENVRRSSAGKNVPVIMLTALDDVESIERAYAAGATDFATKPMQWALLHRRIRYALRANTAFVDLQRSEERYALAAEASNDGLWDWDLKSDHMYFSPRWKAALGLGKDAPINHPDDWLAMIHPDDVARVSSGLAAHLNEANSYFESEHRIRTRQGKYIWVYSRGLAVRNKQGHPYRMAGSQTDITERKETEAQLIRNAFHDPLTGLPNRALFFERLEDCMKLARRRTDYQFALLYMDLDGFKGINDRYGHVQADQLLIDIGARIQRVLRSSDTIARMGGDEFTILFENISDSASVRQSVERVKEAFSIPFTLSRNEMTVSASLGVVFNHSSYRRPEDILRDADSTMYRAKSRGGGISEFCDTKPQVGLDGLANRMSTKLDQAVSA